MATRWAAAAIMVFAAAGCGDVANDASSAIFGSAVQISGAGATLPYPIYSAWFGEYRRRRPDVQINYQAIGSGGGIRQLMNRTVFFGATDGPMTDTQLQAAPGRILHIPTVIGADVPVYNLPGIQVELAFTGQALADIFLGRITRWDAPALTALNPGVALPPLDITVVHRSDGSGTTFIWTDFLSKVSPEWKQTVGVSSAVNWPTGVGGRGSEGVASLVSHTPGALGYVELAYAVQNRLSLGRVQNARGEFVRASPAAVTAAAAAAVPVMPADFRISITNADRAGAYPISSFTWLLLYEDGGDVARTGALVEFITWALTEGQTVAVQRGYGALPSDLIDRELAALRRVKTS